MRKISLLGIALACVVPALAANEGGLNDKDRKVLSEAPQVLQSLVNAPDKGIPRNLLERAECVLVFPSVTKGAFIVGGEAGRGVATCRDSSGVMGAPAFFEVGGASFGWQFGGEQTEFVMLIMDKNGMDQLLKGPVKIGAELSAAAGPVGRSAEASTNATLGSQILSWSRSKGLFVGASLDGAVTKPDKDANMRLYGMEMTGRDILTSHHPVPPEAQSFVEVASRLTGPSGTATAQTGTAYETQTPRATAPTGQARTVNTVSGTVVSVSDTRLVVDTDTGGRQTIVLTSSTNRPRDLRVGSRVRVDLDQGESDLVATRVTSSGSDMAALPRTASPLALYGLSGLCALGAWFLLRQWSVRRA